MESLLLGMWTFTGFDASAHVSEETHDPARRAPWGIVLSVIVSDPPLNMPPPTPGEAFPETALFSSVKVPELLMAPPLAPAFPPMIVKPLINAVAPELTVNTLPTVLECPPETDS